MERHDAQWLGAWLLGFTGILAVFCAQPADACSLSREVFRPELRRASQAAATCGLPLGSYRIKITIGIDGRVEALELRDWPDPMRQGEERCLFRTFAQLKFPPAAPTRPRTRRVRGEPRSHLPPRRGPCAAGAIHVVWPFELVN
ncbi:MAG: hypothetical protein AAGF12_37320 [Myxococcota bacterium]